MKGKALVWLHKLDGDDCEVELFHQSFPEECGFFIGEDLSGYLCHSRRDVWGRELKRMRPGDWVRFTVKWKLSYTRSYCHYYGGYEWDSDVEVTRVRTLARGHYVEPYRARAKR